MHLNSDFFRISFCIVILIFWCDCTSARLANATEYNLLPKLVKLDPYDVCRLKASTNRYCVAELKFRPVSNETSYVWELIQEMNQDPRNFRHDYVRRGLCLERANQTAHDSFEYFQKNFNEEFQTYNFKVYEFSKIVCDYFERRLDVYDIGAIGIIFAIMMFVFGCTFVDTFIWRKQQNLSRGKMYLQCFSLIKNWRRFQSMKESKDNLKFIQGIRFLSISLIVFGHTVFLLIFSAAYDLYPLEEQYRKVSSAIIINGLVIVQTYFFLSGIFLGYAFFKIMFNYKFKFQYLIWAVVGRYNRLAPSFAIVTMINATLLYHVGSGALWEENIRYDRDNCRQYWWANLLYVTNEIRPDKMCMITGWFISADFQLFLFSLCLFTVIWFKREWVLQILGVTFIVSILIPGIITYIYRLDPLPLVYPETMRSYFSNYPTFDMTYLQPHTNASTYICGIIVGYCFYTDHISKTPSRHPLFIGFFHVIGWTASYSVLLGAYYFYTDYYVYDRLLVATFASLYKLIFVVTPLMVICGAKTGYGTIYARFLEWKPLVVLGRLSFSIYLVHWPLIRVVTSLDVIPTYYTYFNVICMKFPAILILSIIFALILALFIEFPISALTNLLTEGVEELKKQSSQATTSTDNNSNNENFINQQNFTHTGRRNGFGVNKRSQKCET